MKATKEDMKSMGRLKRRSDFLRVNDLSRQGTPGAKWVSKSLILLAVPNDGKTGRVGITVTKKLEKTAVGRNRMKRRLRAVSANVIPHGAKPGMDYVLIGRTDSATLPFDTLERDLRWCLKKMGHAIS